MPRKERDEKRRDNKNRRQLSRHVQVPCQEVQQVPQGAAARCDDAAHHAAFCTRMADAGMNPKALQHIMGHSATPTL